VGGPHTWCCAWTAVCWCNWKSCCKKRRKVTEMGISGARKSLFGGLRVIWDWFEVLKVVKMMFFHVVMLCGFIQIHMVSEPRRKTLLWGSSWIFQYDQELGSLSVQNCWMLYFVT
jgi:hypothetical protein